MLMETIANKSNIEDQLEKIAQFILDADADCRVKVTKKSNGTLPLDRHWRALMPQVASLMQSYGVTMRFQSPKGVGTFERAFNEDDAHELFTSMFMPVDDNGRRKSWSKSGRDGMESADTGERVHAMERLYQYWLERGHSLERNMNSEYEELTKRMNE